MMPRHQLSTETLSENETKSTKREGSRRRSEKPISAFSTMTLPAILSRTLDEILTTALDPDDAMQSSNMDDFLTNLWASDEVNTSTITATTGSISPLLHNKDRTLSCTTLWEKTMDEAWAKIQREKTLHSPHTHDQSTLEEITLEEFLVQAGVVKEGHNSCVSLTLSPQWIPGNNSRAQNDGEEKGFNHVLGLGDKNHGNLMCTKSGVYHGEGENKGVVGFGAQQLEMGSPGSQISISTASTHRNASVEHVDGLGLFGREEVGGRSCRGKRGLNDMIGRMMERRKRRMIKNRESAARSRARKRAYTLDLEVEVNQLKEENAALQEDKQRFWAETTHAVLQLMDENSWINAQKTIYTHRRYNSCSW